MRSAMRFLPASVSAGICPSAGSTTMELRGTPSMRMTLLPGSSQKPL